MRPKLTAELRIHRVIVLINLTLCVVSSTSVLYTLRFYIEPIPSVYLTESALSRCKIGLSPFLFTFSAYLFKIHNNFFVISFILPFT